MLILALIAGPGPARADDDREAQLAPEGPAEAEELEPTRPTREAPSAVDEVVVTGRRREESLQKVPMSAVSLGATALREQSISRIDEIGKSVGNLIFDPASGSNDSARIYIRGIGQDDARDLKDPKVGIYVDGAYIPRADSSLFDLVDVSRIEVLRGPQGTLFGKNTIGGAILVHTRRPAKQLGASVRAKWGNYGLLETHTSFDVPLSFGPFRERAFSRFSFTTATDDGWTRNLVDGERTGDAKLLGFRFAFEVFPTDATELFLTFDRSRRYQKGRITKCVEANPITAIRFTFDNFHDYDKECARSGNAPKGTGFLDPLPDNEDDAQGVLLSYKWHPSEQHTLALLGSWRRLDEATSRWDVDGTAADVLQLVDVKGQHDAWSQELTWNGSFREDRVRSVAGVYGFFEKGSGSGELYASREIIPDPKNPALTPEQQVLQDRVQLTSNRLSAGNPGGSTLIDVLKRGNFSSDTDWKTHSFAGFAHVEVDPLPELTLEGGVRFTAERKERDQDRLMFFTEESIDGVLRSRRDDAWTPTAKASYRFTDRIMAYAGWSRGWASGGFNESFVDPDADPGDRNSGGAFDPETVDSFELGLKTRFWDDRATVNFAAFYSKYRDMQLTTIRVASDGLPEAFTENAGSAILQGIELDGAIQPLEGLTFDFSAGVLNARYREFDTSRPKAIQTSCTSLRNAGLTGKLPFLFLTEPGDCGLGDLLVVSAPDPTGQRSTLFDTVTETVDLSGNDLKHAPAYDFSVGVTYELPVLDFGDVVTHVRWSHTSAFHFNVDNTPSLEQNKHGYLDGRIQFNLSNDKTFLALWGKNLLDRSYRDGTISLGTSAGADALWWAWPRRYGIEVQHLFD